MRSVPMIPSPLFSFGFWMNRLLTGGGDVTVCSRCRPHQQPLQHDLLDADPARRHGGGGGGAAPQRHRVGGQERAPVQGVRHQLQQRGRAVQEGQRRVPRRTSFSSFSPSPSSTSPLLNVNHTNTRPPSVAKRTVRAHRSPSREAGEGGGSGGG